MTPPTRPPSPSTEPPTPLLDADQAGSESRPGEHQDARGTPPPSRLTLNALKGLARWANRMKARKAQPQKLDD